MDDRELVETTVNAFQPDRDLFAIRNAKSEDLRASDRLRVENREVPIQSVNLPETRETLERVREPLAGNHGSPKRTARKNKIAKVERATTIAIV